MKTVVTGVETELIEKKSRFLGEAYHVESEEEVAEVLAAIRKKYWDANHHCYAFSVGETMPTVRCTDDGEPAGTAGRPILQVFQGMELYNSLVVVTRYFGGTLLGTGGLVRAYGGSAKLALEAAEIVERIEGVKMRLKMTYTELGKVQYILAQAGMNPVDTIYTDGVEMELHIPQDVEKRLVADLVEGTNGRIEILDREIACILKKV